MMLYKIPKMQNTMAVCTVVHPTRSTPYPSNNHPSNCYPSNLYLIGYGRALQIQFCN